MNIKNFKKFAKKPCNFHCYTVYEIFIAIFSELLYSKYGAFKWKSTINISKEWDEYYESIGYYTVTES